MKFAAPDARPPDTRPSGARVPRAILVGAGLMGRWHADAVRHAGYPIAAVVDLDAQRASALASRYTGARAATTLREVAAAGDVVHVCTPVSTHSALAEAALAAGCHAIVEKPLAERAETVRALLARADAAERVLVPVHQYLFQPGVLRAERLLDVVGPVLHADAVACTAGADGRSDAEHDRIALEILPHPLSLFARLVAPEVDMAAWHVTHSRPGELRASGTLGAISVSILVSTHGRPTRNTLLLVGARGTVRLDLFHGYAVVIRGEPTRAFKVAHPFVDAARTAASAAANLAVRAVRRETAYPGLRELVRRVYDAVQRNGPAPIAAAEMLAVARARDQIADAGRAPAPAAIHE